MQFLGQTCVLQIACNVAKARCMQAWLTQSREGVHELPACLRAVSPVMASSSLSQASPLATWQVGSA